MSMTAKELKKLVKACRQAGIKTYKGDGVEFTLSDEAPSPPIRRSAKNSQSSTSITVDKDFETDALTEEQLLFYSATGGQTLDFTDKQD